jgi:hypothetical protein
MRDDAVAIVNIAEPEHALFQAIASVADTVDWWNKCAASGRDQKLVVSLSDSCFGGDDLGRPIDFDDRRAGVKHDVVRTVPVEWVDENLTGVLRAAQDAGKQDPVVVPIGFVAEHRDVELITAASR